MTRELELFIEKLRVETAKYADESLRKPADRTAFGFGKTCGLYQGLLRAEQILTEAIEELQDE